MFTRFILSLRHAGIPASMTEYLSLLGAIKLGVAAYDVDDFYYLSRTALVKDERHLDKFDRVFGECFKGLERTESQDARELPEEWLRKMAEKLLTADEMAQIAALGGFDALMETLKQRLANRNPGIKAGPNGSARQEHRRSERKATIRRASGSARRSAATGAA